MHELPEIRWPSHYHPSCTPIHVCNELAMAAPAERVWAWLIRAPLWPTWYANSKNVEMLEGPAPDLGEGSRFRWTTFGVRIESRVLECVPGQRLAWDAHGTGVDAYHAWILRETAQGCDVRTEETQHGWLVRLGALVLPNRMHKHHQIWLEELERKAREGMPA